MTLPATSAALGRALEPASPVPLDRMARWTLTTTDGATVRGPLPDWAEEDPSAAGIPGAELAQLLADLHHWRDYEGQMVYVHTRDTGEAGRPPHREQILTATITCHPYARDRRPRIPVASVQISPDCWMTDLDPSALSDLAARLHAQADRLNHEVCPALVAARCAWPASAEGIGDVHEHQEG